ncbi:protein-tyrosine phosphatase-like protein [Mycena epipterygia]|nr:protein-tyrosine phosphatase-like protein [Mycena epipterygia]
MRAEIYPAVAQSGSAIVRFEQTINEEELCIRVLGLHDPVLPGARNLELLRHKGITHIISVMVPGPAHRETQTRDDGFHRMIIPVQDWPDEELLTHFKHANAFIDNARGTAGAGVLVHCQQGVSRSATIVAAYLMTSHPPTPTSAAAIAFLRARRPQVQPNSGFVDQLALYGRCGCNLDLEVARNRNAVEAWRAGRHRQWEGHVDRLQRMKDAKKRKGGAWSRLRGWAALVSRWVGSIFA